MGREVINLSSRDLQMNDTSPYNKFADVSVVANVPVVVGEYEVPAGVKRATWGGGKLYMVLYDDTTTAEREEGQFIFSVVGPSGAQKETHRIQSYEAGPSGKTADLDVWKMMPEGGNYTIGGGKLRITFISNGSDTLDTTDCLIYAVPAVIYT